MARDSTLPAVEAGVLLAVRSLYLVAYAAVFAIDVRTGRIPNLITYPLLAFALVARPDGIGPPGLGHLIGAIACFLLFGALTLRGWMGMGDAKLGAAIMLASGPVVGVVALWLAFVLGAAVGIALIALGRASRRTAVPFGPFLAVAGALAAVVPEALAPFSPLRPLLAS